MHETTILHDTIRGLVSEFVTHPDNIELTTQHASDACLWLLKGHPDDEPKLIGRQGAHINALRFLVSQFGRARNEVHTLRLVTVREPGDRPRATTKAAMTWDPAKHRELLTDVLSELPIDLFQVTVDPGAGARELLTFSFRILVRSESDHTTLTAAARIGNETTILAALQTLFRAIACEHGIRYELSVGRSKP